MKKITENQENDFGMWFWGVIITLLIICSWIGTLFLLKDYPSDVRGTFGDMFGSINALFSGLALAGIIFTILLQRKELMLQRKELSDTREEFKIQNVTLRLQRFENTFFNLLSLHHQIVNAIDIDVRMAKSQEGSSVFVHPPEYETVMFKGRDVFSKRFEQLREHLKQDNEFTYLYSLAYDLIKSDFGHYFRNLYRIIKLVKKTEFHSYSELGLNSNSVHDNESYEQLNFNTRYKYTSMIRAQLSDDELLWLFYNGLSENGKDKFKPLIEEFSLLKNIPIDKVHDRALLDEYDSKAFGNI